MSNENTITKGYKVAPLLNGTAKIIAIPKGRQAYKTKLMVTSVRDMPDNTKLAELFPDTYSHTYLMNFEAVEARNVSRILEAFQLTKDYDEDEQLSIISWEEAKGMQFSHSVNVFTNMINEETGEDGRPMEFDEVTATIKYAMTKEGDHVNGQFDITGEPITDETPDNMKGKVLEIGSFIVPQAIESDDITAYLAKANAKHVSNQTPEDRPTLPVNENEESLVEEESTVKAEA